MTVLVSRLIQYRTLWLIFVLWIITSLFAAIFDSALIVAFDLGILDESQMGGEVLDSLSFQDLFLFVLVVTPTVESWIFQLALLLLTKKLTEWLAKSNSQHPAFLITSLPFAALHAGNAEDVWSIYGMLHVVARIPMGFALALLAKIERARKGGAPVLSMILLHTMYNAVPFMLFV